MWAWLAKGARAVATGNAQAKLGIQSPHLPGAVVRVGRFLYGTSLLWITGCWYTGYVNKRTESSGGGWSQSAGPRLIIGGKVINRPDRPDKTPNIPTIGHGTAADNQPKPTGFVPQTADQAGRQLIAITSAQLNAGVGINGYLWTAPNGKKQLPAFDRNRYNGLLVLANNIARQYGLHITSGYRAADAGRSLHGSGIAFDLVGNMAQMKRAATWASTNPAMFQEIFIHNEGSGLHLHLGFYPDAAGIWSAATNKYARPGGGARSLAATGG